MNVFYFYDIIVIHDYLEPPYIHKSKIKCEFLFELYSNISSFNLTTGYMFIAICHKISMFSAIMTIYTKHIYHTTCN